MLEKMKKWDWKLIVSAILALVFLALYLLVGVELAINAEYAPFQQADYVPTSECIYGFAVGIMAVVFGFFVYYMWKTGDIIISKRRKK